MILLDTCTLLWLALDQSGLSPSARLCLSERAGNLYVSAITAFEIGQKCAAGKLKFQLKTRACHGAGLGHGWGA